MIGLIAQAKVQGPSIDWAALSPLVALTGGACVVLMVGPAAGAVHPRRRSCRC